MNITKTDYLEYTFCKKNLWLKKHKPELFEGIELSDFEKKIIEEGNIADEEARKLFPEGVLVDCYGEEAVEDTKQYIENKQEVIFQATFAEDVFFIRSDILVYNKEKDGYELYEVKASNGVKRKEPFNYINDLAFQKSVIEKSSLNVIKTGVIHLNKNYKKFGKIDYNEVFTTVDLTNEVFNSQEAVKQQMSDIKQYLDMPEEKGCECLYRGRNDQCTTFAYSNPDVPEYSVHDINRIGGSKKLFHDWIDRGIYTLEEIDKPEALTGAKKAQYDAYMLNRPIVNPIAIKESLDKLVFPLYFFDYEGFVSAIPMFDGFGAYEQVPFQYSLHIMQKDGSIEHKEFLITDPKGDLTRPLVERIGQDIEPNGTVIAWYSSYEKQRNTKLAELHPDYADFLENINEGMFDLMTIFSKNYYVDPAFKGSSSIKKVLPVIVPELTYKNLNISKGDQASERWEKMINPNTSQEEKDQIAKDLLEYCKLDTWAMVKIYEFLRKI
ncbi:MAG: hypothetical protein CO137_00610 [Candidatus Magasanikbacteria bacterium CG_4_9_14_3_um_filter_32_9]|uniref:DUF2779 domain-containing protein n=1 Tax=Candidatus Magasanikbacteria bacterium CG_4_9_14_3_um_filter_32_9 TaxID=1974644 RepID=A0A2M7Z7L7_9BACT|nr:MAG: hypothetical protein CO137_00610 [Candidatus Magasanikbacteria bacterium CG_4_9_14_3_um_filter_32_9]